MLKICLHPCFLCQYCTGLPTRRALKDMWWSESWCPGSHPIAEQCHSQWLEHMSGTWDKGADWLLESYAGLKIRDGKEGLKLPAQTSESEAKVTTYRQKKVRLLDWMNEERRWTGEKSRHCLQDYQNKQRPVFGFVLVWFFVPHEDHAEVFSSSS